MAADAYITVRYSEVLRIESGTFEPVSGTVTLASVAVTLRDAQGATVEGCDGVAATAFTSGASVAPYGQYQFSASGLDLDEPTFATGPANYTLHYLGTSTTGQVWESVVAIVLKPDGA